MMLAFRKYIPIFLAVIMLAMALIPGLAAPVEGRPETEPALQGRESSTARSRSSTEEPSGEGMVEIMIFLREQANVEKAAQAVRAKHPSSTGRAPATGPAAGLQNLKNETAIAVVEALQETASRTQGPLLRILEQEKRKGRVEEFESFFIMNAVYARLSEDLVKTIEKLPQVESVRPNQRFRLGAPLQEPLLAAPSAAGSIKWNIERVNAPDVWALDIDGSGVVVGIMDSGVDLRHEALERKYRGYSSPGSYTHAYNWYDHWYDDAPEPDDWLGHGSHITGTVLGSDPADNHRIGVAPGAQWIAARAFDDNGVGTTRSITKSGQYLLAPTPNRDGSGTPDPTKAPHIINCSWEADEPDNGSNIEDSMLPLIQSWRAAGILPVFAAGTAKEEMPGSGSIAYPALYPETLAVGATADDDTLAWFSKRGPAPYPAPYDLKPDISAPGVNIYSVYAGGNEYGPASGTSFAAPHIAGVAALLLEDNPGLNPTQLEQLILDTALPLTDSAYPGHPNFGYGYGLVDALAAINNMPEPVPPAEGYAWNILDLGGIVPEGPVEVEIPGRTLGSLKAYGDPDNFWMTGADFVNDTWYAVSNESPSGLYSIDTFTGEHTLVGSTGIAEMTGLAYDSTTRVLYGSGLAGNNSNLYTVDLNTGAASLVGTIASNKTVIGIAADRTGNLFGLTLEDNSLYAISKASGAGTVIGLVGYDINFDQDIAFDRDNDILYGTLFDGVIFTGGLYQIDTATGKATLLNNFIDELGAFAIKYTFFNLFLDRSGEGTIEIDGEVASLPFETGFIEGTSVELKAIPATGWVFDKWIIDGEEVFEEDTTVTMDDDVDAVAYFLELHTLSVDKVGEGSVLVDGVPVDLTFNEDYPHGTTVTLEAEAETGWVFDNWIINGNEVFEEEITVTMDEDKNVTAVFKEIEHTLTINKIGEGTVKVDSVPVELTFNEDYPYGTTVTIEAVPDTGWEFEKWVIDGVDVLDPFTTVTMNDDVSAVAQFKELPSEGEIDAVVFEVEEGGVSYIEAVLLRWALAFFNQTGDPLYDLVEGGSIIGIRSGTKYPELISYAVGYYNYDGDVAKAIAAAEELDQAIIDMIELYVGP